MSNLAAMDDSTHAAPLRIDELLSPAAFPHPVAHLELRETHMSWVILTGPFAYKIKKPDLLNAATLEARRRHCEAELRLNRRYAAEIYMDVVPISRHQGRAVLGVAGSIIDYAVRMHQFDAAHELSALLETNAIALSEVMALAELLADFHMSAPLARTNGGHPNTQRIYKAVLGNLAQLIARSPAVEPPGGLGRLIDWTHDHARSLEGIFQAREDSGCIRECHGDMHAAHIVRWQGRLIPFDCSELEPQLHWIDVMDDLAFLVMDLASRGRADLACSLLSRYLEITGDYEGVLLLRFYAVYRALVRAKADALAAEQMPQRAAEFADRLHQRICAAAAWITPKQPVLLLMHGPSGSGKSWLSERLVAPLAAIRVRSDLERKRLAGIKPHLCAAAGLWQGIYSTEFTQKTYERLADCATKCLRAGFTTIVDAAFLAPEDRERFRELAAQCGAAFLIVSCQSDAATLSSRVTQRSRARSDVANARLAVLDAQLRTIQPVSASEQKHAIVLDTKDTNAIQRVVASVAMLERQGIVPEPMIARCSA